MGQKSTTDGSKTTFKKGSSEAGWAKNQQLMGEKSTTDGPKINNRWVKNNL
jgi:hypothetical protein